MYGLLVESSQRLALWSWTTPEAHAGAWPGCLRLQVLDEPPQAAAKTKARVMITRMARMIWSPHATRNRARMRRRLRAGQLPLLVRSDRSGRRQLPGLPAAGRRRGRRREGGDPLRPDGVLRHRVRRD